MQANTIRQPTLPKDLVDYLNADAFDDRKTLELFIEKSVRRRLEKPFLYLLAQHYAQFGPVSFIPDFALKFLSPDTYDVRLTEGQNNGKI